MFSHDGSTGFRSGASCRRSKARNAPCVNSALLTQVCVITFYPTWQGISMVPDAGCPAPIIRTATCHAREDWFTGLMRHKKPDRLRAALQTVGSRCSGVTLDFQIAATRLFLQMRPFSGAVCTMKGCRILQPTRPRSHVQTTRPKAPPRGGRWRPPRHSGWRVVHCQVFLEETRLT